MKRHPDSSRLATMVRRGQPVADPLEKIAEMLARYHESAERGRPVESARPRRCGPSLLGCEADRTHDAVMSDAFTTGPSAPVPEGLSPQGADGLLPSRRIRCARTMEAEQDGRGQ